MSSPAHPAHHESGGLLENGHIQERTARTPWLTGRDWSKDLSKLPFFQKEVENPSSRKSLPTAWMNGLRGVACVVVFNFHYLFAFDQIALVGYGANENAMKLLALPFIRIIYEGVTAVSIFFCISGYVCSAKALKLMHARESDSALRGLSVSVFRRYLRLYLPVLFWMTCQAILAQLGAYDIIRPMFQDRDHYWPGNFTEAQLRHAPSILDQFKFMLGEFWTLSELWRPGEFYSKHDPHYWTIPKEAGSGLVLFLVLFGLSTCRSGPRLAGLLLLAVVAIRYNKYDTMLFLVGAAMAQYEILSKQKAAEKDSQLQTASIGPTSHGTTAKANIVKAIRSLGYVAAIYFMCFPRVASKIPAPNDRFILALVPRWIAWREMFVKCLGSMLLIFLLLTSEHQISALRPSLLHRICNSRFALYMGRIMYPFYLVHGTVLHIFGYAIPYWVWAIIGQDNPVTYLFGFVVGWSISFAASIWLAEMFARYVEPRCAKLTERIQELCS